jgi:uncharacterized protein (UPF0303 family)
MWTAEYSFSAKTRKIVVVGSLAHSSMRSGIECLKRNRKNGHQQPHPGSLSKTGWAKAGVNIPLSQ